MKKILLFIFLFSAIIWGQNNEREVAVTFDDLPATNGDYESYKYIIDNLLHRCTCHN